MLKKLSVAIAVASSVAFSSMAVSETVESPIGKLDVSMTATLASDWLNRGRALNGAPTVQGSLDVAHESGVYVGIWGGSMSDSRGSEFDYYIGYAGDINKDFSFNLTAATYTYPGIPGDDDVELLGSVSAYGATAGVKYLVKTEGDVKSLYTYAAYDLALPGDFGLMLSVGQTDPEKGDGYIDWNVGIKKPFAGLDLALIYGSTDIDKADCGAYSCENNFVFSASKTF
jgi:uncharacterized protein (TIGR02001 family)